MKGHKRGICRPNPWCEHGNNNKQHGGHYEWETQQWDGSEWKPIVVTAVAENKVVVETEDSSKTVPISQIMQAPPPGTCPERDAWLAFCKGEANESDSEEESDNWKPKTPRYLWDYYKIWQHRGGIFPTTYGMTSEQLGDIMQNYSKYAEYYQ